MIRNIVFDMGMVLMDYHPLIACRAVAPDEEAALQVNEALFLHPAWPGLDDGSLDKEELAGMAEGRLANPALRPLVRQILGALPCNVLSPMPGMAELTDHVLEAGYRVYLLSNAGWDVSRNRDIIPRIERFHGVIFSVEEGVIKPNPALYRRLTDRYGLVPEECLFIDDNPDNIRGARDLGWQGYLFDGDVPALQRALDGLAL